MPNFETTDYLITFASGETVTAYDCTDEQAACLKVCSYYSPEGRKSRDIVSIDAKGANHA